MNRFSLIALVSLPLSLAAGCSDDGSSDTGQGGSQSNSDGGTQNSSNGGTGGSSSAAAGSGGSSSGLSGAGGDSAGGASGTGGTGGSSSGNPTVEDVCQRGCVKTESLNCPNDPPDCEAACLADYLDFPAECRELVLALGQCAADRPASDFVCDDEGEAILRPGICGAESIAVATCVFDAL